MIKSNLFPVIILLSLTFFGCSETLDEGFATANDKQEQFLLERIEITSYENPSTNRSYSIIYDNYSRVRKITDGTLAKIFHFSDAGELKRISGVGKSMNISDFYRTPYNAFETGNVKEFDSFGNPIEIEVIKDHIGNERLTGYISYDRNPNPFFHTLRAAGIIDMLDRVNLNFSMMQPSVIRARTLLPFNSITSMVFKDVNGIITYEGCFEYDYNEFGYPINTMVTGIYEGEAFSYSMTYSYKDSE